MADEYETCYRHPDRRAGVKCQRCERSICPSCMATASVGFHCPECARSGRQKVYTRANLPNLNRPWVTQVLIGINAAVFVAGLAEQSSNAIAGRGGFIFDGGLNGRAVDAGEWWRIVTSGFLHAGLFHVGMNMLLLYQLGTILEPMIGRVRFVALYFTCLLTGSLGVLVLQPDGLHVGASGAVFGLMGATVFAMRARGINPFQTGLGTLLVINLVITFAIHGISVGGHLGGLAGGFACGYLLFDLGPKQLRNDAATGGVMAALGAVAAAACLLVA